MGTSSRGQEVGVGQKRVTRLRKLPLQEAVARARPEVEANPSILTMLAFKRDGTPDWQVRISAARA